LYFCFVNSNTEENYLKAIFLHTDGVSDVQPKELSESLGVKMPTINSMMKRLVEKGLVDHASYKPIRLTVAGCKMAALVIRKHRLTEMFLVEKMGFGWEEVHEIAEQIEHIKSPIFFEKMNEMLGSPKQDPHGSPIPDKDGIIDRLNFPKLSNCSALSEVRLVAVNNSSEDFLKFLNTREISLGLKIKVLAVEAFDGSMTVVFQQNRQEVLSKMVCDRLLVTPLK
jgi:DtxR family Mn-dependent transcriptional regulator